MKKDRIDPNLERKNIHHYRKINSGHQDCTQLIDIFPDGKFPINAYIHCEYGYTVYNIDLRICWEVAETDEQYEQRIRDYRASERVRQENIKAANEKRAKTLAAKKEKEKQKELELLKSLISKYPEVISGEKSE